MISVLRSAVAVVGLLFATSSFAQEPAPLSVYGNLPAYDEVRLSDSGDRLAYISIVGEERSLIINSLEDMSLIGGVRAGQVKVRGLDWVGEDYVLVQTSATQASDLTGWRRVEFYDGQIYAIPTRRVVRVFSHTEDVMSKLGGSPIVRGTNEAPLLIVPGQGRKGLGLYVVDPATGQSDRKIQDQEWAGNYIIDAAGNPVARARYDDASYRWELQIKRGDFWRTVWTKEAPLDQPSLVGLGTTARQVVVWGGDGAKDDEMRVYDIDANAWSDLPFDGAPTSIISHPRSRLLVGARTVGETGDTYQFLDPTFERMWRSVKAAFPGKQVRIQSLSNDLRQIVVRTEGPGDPGTYQLVDMDRRSAEIIGEEYPLRPDQVGEVRAISYAAADGMRIPGYLTLPPGVSEPKGLPLVVLPHGGPASRDYYGFDWWAQALASRGYAVLQPNFRGSDGLGQAHLEAGYGEWGRKMQTDLSDGVRWLASEGIVDPAKVCIVGASYGGYAALAGPTLDPGVYRCAVSVAGVSDLRAMVQWSASQSGRRDTSSVRYWNRFMGAERLGDRALDALSPAYQVDKLTVPVLLLHGRDDTVVPIIQSRRFVDAARSAGKPVEFVELSSEDHWLSKAATRLQMLTETVRFLEANNPAH